ncbi:hypothetical protein SELMODRAFT_406465 [Selaginella moellendorffii]|uniref:Uncharacterized protein n=1 Tax=Selaginella moellendorffii TaxID=88036 RepID=D8R2F9_SELML|nr:hypothetical protein SELMODRAFT_406465 [Selaginella moellendorffii]
MGLYRSVLLEGQLPDNVTFVNLLAGRRRSLDRSTSTDRLARKDTTCRRCSGQIQSTPSAKKFEDRKRIFKREREVIRDKLCVLVMWTQIVLIVISLPGFNMLRKLHKATSDKYTDGEEKNNKAMNRQEALGLLGGPGRGGHGESKDDSCDETPLQAPPLPVLEALRDS